MRRKHIMELLIVCCGFNRCAARQLIEKHDQVIHEGIAASQTDLVIANTIASIARPEKPKDQDQ